MQYSIHLSPSKIKRNFETQQMGTSIIQMVKKQVLFITGMDFWFKPKPSQKIFPKKETIV